MSTTSKHIEARRKVAAALKQQVCEWLSWNELDYAEFQYESGLLYLRHYIPHDKWGQDMLQRSAIFWNWWKNEWSRRDAEFLCPETEDILRQQPAYLLRQIYAEHHNPVLMASEVWPDRVVLEESYNQMISQLIKETVNA